MRLPFVSSAWSSSCARNGDLWFTMSRREVLTRSRPCKTGEWMYVSASFGEWKAFTLGIAPPGFVDMLEVLSTIQT